MIELAQGARQVEGALGREQLPDRAIGRREEYRLAAVDERVAYGTERVTLTDAGQSERQHIRRLDEEVAFTELSQLADERGRQPSFVERVEGFAGRQLGRAAEPRDPPGPTLVRFELEDGEQDWEGRLLVRFDEPRHELARGGREREPGGAGS